MSAEVDIEEIVEHLSSQFRRALEDTVKHAIPGATFDAHELFREFKRALRRKCNDWEDVPATSVRVPDRR